MLLGGDEFGRTQLGNNNGYCQDNDISWYDWSLVEANEDLVEFTTFLINLRRQHPVFHRRRFFFGRAFHGSDCTDIAWFTPEGGVMSEDDWRDGPARSMTVFLNGEAIPDPDTRGERVVDDSFLLVLNADPDAVEFTVPAGDYGERWRRLFTSGQRRPDGTDGPTVKAGDTVILDGHTTMLFQREA
jgi:glycogen operon protein